MKTVRSQLRMLVAKKEQHLGRNVSLRSVHRDADVPISTIMGLANNTIERITLTDIRKLCLYFQCDVGDLLKLEELPNEREDSNAA